MGGKSQTSTQQVQIPPSVLARYNSVNQQAQTAAATPFQQYSTNPNAFVAPVNSTQQAGITQAQSAANEAQPYYGAATSALTGANSASQPYYGAATGLIGQSAEAVNPTQIGASQIDQFLSPYLSQVLGSTAGVLNQNNQQQQAGQLGNAINSGAFGGDRTGVAAANLEEQQNLANANIYSGIENQGFNTALGAAQQQQGVNLGAAQANRAALGQAGTELAGLGQTIYGQGANEATNLAGLGSGAQSAAESGAASELAAGQVQQQTTQAGDTALYNQFLQQQSYPFQVAQFLANIAEGTGALSGSTTSTTTPGGLFSDRRLKEDVRKIGKTFDGQTIYSFRYKDDPHNLTRMGLMAQDVEKHTPDAVGLAGGFKTVDYDKATEKAADRGHFADGGSPDIAALLQAQEASYAPFNSAGIAGVSSAPRGGTSYVPASTTQPGHLAVAGGLATPPSAVQNMTDWANLAKAGTGAASAIGGAWNKFTQPAPTASAGAAPPVAANDAPAFDSSMGDTPQYRHGGRMRRAAGGLAHAYADGGMPYDDQSPLSLSIPDDPNQHQLATASNLPGGGQSTIGQIGAAANAAGDIAKAASTILPMIGLARGGRAGFDTGGTPSYTDPNYDAAGSWQPTIDAVTKTLGDTWNNVWNTPFHQKPGPVQPAPSAPSDPNYWKTHAQPDNGAGLAPAAAQAPPPRPVTAGDVARAVGPNAPVHVTAPPAPGLAPTVSTALPDPVSATQVSPSDITNPSAGMSDLDTSTPSANPTGGLAGIGDAIGNGAKSVAHGLDPQGGFIDNLMHGKASSIVPLLTGLAAMTAAPTRNGFVALTQGLGAGAQTYMNNQEQAAKIAQEQAQVGQTQAMTGDIQAQQFNAQNAIFKEHGLVLVPDPNGTVVIGSQHYSAKPIASAIAKGTPGTGAETAAPYHYLSPSDVPAATSSFNRYMGADAGTQGQSQTQQNAIISAGDEAESHMPTANRWLSSVASVPDGPLALGAFHDAREQAVNEWNTLLGTIVHDPAKLAQMQIGGLDASQIASKLAIGNTAVTEAGLGQRSYGSLQALIKGTPNNNMQRGATIPLVVDDIVNNQRAVDQAGMVKEMGNALESQYPTQGRNFLTPDAVQLFNNNFPAARYEQERNNLQKLALDPAFPKINAALQAGTAEQRAQMAKMLDAKYGDGFHRYLTGTW